LAAATSTGGLVGKALGRVGDSPVIGAGLYADDALGIKYYLAVADTQVLTFRRCVDHRHWRIFTSLHCCFPDCVCHGPRHESQ